MSSTPEGHHPDPDVPEGTVVLARLTIERQLWPDGRDVINYYAEDSGGERPPLLEQLGMLTMSIDTAKEMAMGGDGDD